MNEVSVDLGDRSYPIFVEEGLLQGGLIKDYISGSQVLVISNETIAPLYMDIVLQELVGLNVDSLVLPDGEKYKNLEVFSQILDALILNRHNRTTTLVALGGGVIGDMTGFAAACYQRGVNFVQVPTTLLAQVDSSVGGKTAVNHPEGKNMIGAFHQPKAVFIDPLTLKTLPDREYSAGVAEVVKYGLIEDYAFFCWLEDKMDALMARDSDTIIEAVRISCLSKAKIVAADETEQGKRAILNLGHTFGHAIEAAQHYKDWLHGEAVSAGMMLAAELSRRLQWLSAEQVDRARELLLRARLPVEPPTNIGTEKFIELMGLDKKVLNGKLRLVLLRELGDAVVTEDFSIAELKGMLDEVQDH